METYSITILPDEKSVEVEPGTTLMEAAEKVRACCTDRKEYDQY
jgi:hypothetical protein